MIRVNVQPQPSDFADKVERKGQSFLAKNPHPKSWKNRSYWTNALPDLRRAYSSVCSYCCHWIPAEQGSASVDHFIPKSVDPSKAYDWYNYRLAASKMNAKKGDYQDVLDPFELKPDMFILLFPALLVKPHPGLTLEEKQQVWATIKRLQLNKDEVLINSRLQWILEFCDGHIDFEHLQRRAPFIAYEIERQNLASSLTRMFSRRNV